MILKNNKIFKKKWMRMRESRYEDAKNNKKNLKIKNLGNNSLTLKKKNTITRFTTHRDGGFHVTPQNLGVR